VAFSVEQGRLSGILVISTDRFPDGRGFFMETFHAERYSRSGMTAPFVQDNFSHSARGTLRGLHYQIERPQGKLVTVLHGEIYDVVVDLRKSSGTFGQWEGFTLSEENRRQLYVPVGFAHGFCVVSPLADVIYKCTDFYCPPGERGLLWSDPVLNIRWPLEYPVLSARDAGHPRFNEIPTWDLFD